MWDYLLWWGNALTYAVMGPMGSGGWELVAVIHTQAAEEFRLQAVFKRPKVTP